jgi:hypothetical protein
MAVAVLSRADSTMHNSESIEGKYANYFQIGQNAIEFVFEFGQLYSDEPVPLLHTRIVTSPSYAKDLLVLLKKALAEHETQYGPASSVTDGSAV